MNEWYRRPGNAQRVRDRVIEYRNANLDQERAKDLARASQRRRDPETLRVRRAAYYAIQVGTLTRQPCEVCGATKVDMHHDDYSAPLAVRWLCRKHHMELHRTVND
jgi:ribosomal protein S27AE